MILAFTILGGLMLAADSKPLPPVTSAAYAVDGKRIAVAGYGEVFIVDASSGDVMDRQAVGQGPLTALAWSRSGQLAAATGKPGQPPVIRFDGRILAGPKDSIFSLALTPDSKRLIGAGYDRQIYIWDLPEAKPRVLRDHSDGIYGLAISPDGSLLASVAADRTVKIWDISSGKRLYSLSEPTDWVYAVAWHPDGKRLAASGIDRTIRIWQISPTEGKLAKAQFAHEGSVLKLAYSPDGKRLYSLAEDRLVKAWDAESLTELKLYPKQPDATLTLAIRPDGKQLALGRYDGALVLIDVESAKTVTAFPAKPKPPQVTQIEPKSGLRRRTTRVTMTGQQLDTVSEASADGGVSVKIEPGPRDSKKLVLEVEIPESTPAGRLSITLKSDTGSVTVPWIVDIFESEKEASSNDSQAAAPIRPLDRTYVGSCDRAGDIDFFRFECKDQQEVGIQCISTAIGSKLDPVLEWIDPSGAVIARSSNGLLGVRCSKAGVYALSIRDREFRGGQEFFYRIHIGTVPVVSSVFPLGLKAGSKALVQVFGVHLAMRSVEVSAPPDAKPGTKLPVTINSELGPVAGAPTIVVDEFPEAAAGSKVLPVPGSANGVISRPGNRETWRFQARKGERLILEVQARRLDSPLDSVLEIADAKGKPVERMVLRGVAQVFQTFRDVDSANSGIRLESWNELAMNDFVLIDRELARIDELPRNPDDDCRFYSVGGSRLAFLDTTPTAHANGTPVVKVTMHPPGTTFPPNGLPLVRLYYQNDDGGPGYGKDSRISFDPPADGEYQVIVSDARSEGSPSHAYRLTVRPPRPDFSLTLGRTMATVPRGGAQTIPVTVTRLDGFTGPIQLTLKDLPDGFHSAPGRIDPDRFSTSLALSASKDAKSAPESSTFQVIGQAIVDGISIARSAMGGRISIAEPGAIITKVAEKEVTIRPGQETVINVAIERREGFKGRVPLDLKGLPHGVRVLNIGLNGILITERETTRQVVLYAEPWVQPASQTFVVVATQEGKSAEHAAPPVLLRIEGK